MSHLVVGLSHHTAPLAVLERILLDATQVAKLLDDLVGTGQVDEALVVATCNRLEVVAEVGRFHAGVDAICAALATHADVPIDELRELLYVHYEDAAVRHLFGVAAGLDSMVVGETQVLGQVRSALRVAQDAGTVGRALHELVRQALHVGKRVHAETDLSRTSRSLVELSLAEAERAVGSLEGRRAVVVGAGTMSSLAAHALRAAGADIVVVNRTTERGQRLADAVHGRSVPLDRLAVELIAAEVVVSCTASNGYVLDAPALVAATVARPGRPVAVVDLALPRDVDPRVGEIAGVHLVSLERLQEVAAVPGGELAAIVAARAVVTDEVSTYLGVMRAARVAPTVVALRTMAAHVVEAELTRLSGRLPQLAPGDLDEVSATVRRVVDKLLHAPTVRVKQQASDETGPDYESALRHLFALDPRAVEAVSTYDLDIDIDEDVAT